MRPTRWACCSGWLLWLLLGLAFEARAAVPGVLMLEQAEFLRSDVAEPPGDEAPWQALTLPDYWPLTRPRETGYAWYRLHFRIASIPERQQALLFAWLRTSGAAYLNGIHVGQSGEFGHVDPGARPQLFEFRPQLLKAGDNVLHVRLWVGGRLWTGRLSVVMQGDKAELLELLDERRFVMITVAQLAGVFSFTVGTYMLLIWLMRRRERMFGHFAAASLLSAAWIAFTWGFWFGLPEPLALLIGVISNNLPVALLFVFSLRFAGWRWQRTERAVWVYIMLAVLIEGADALLGQPLPIAFRRLWMPPALAGLLLTIVIAWRQRSVESALLCLGFAYMNIAFTYDIFAAWTEVYVLLATHLVPLQLIIGFILLRRFVRSLAASEQLGAELEQRVAAKHAELEHNYAQMEQMARTSAIAEERGRIMSDMHDGIGAQLISTLSLVEHSDASSKQVAAALRECIDDLRLAIDSLEPTDDDLLPVLGNLRYRLEPRLAQQGIALDWQVGEVPKLACLTPRNVLHVLRILQEAFTNILKHAQASRIRVDTRVAEGGVSIRVSDNGKGFGETRGAGHGLASMKQRAQALGGELRIEPSPTGTTLDLLLPIG